MSDDILRGYNFDNRYFHFVGEVGPTKAPESKGKRSKTGLNGVGVLYFSDGGSVEGEFSNGELNGFGARRWADGSSYTGEFLHGEFHGKGRLVKVPSPEYEGEFRLGVFEGYGEYVDRIRGEEYQGEFKNHRFDGQGSFLKDGVSCQGSFHQGLPHGQCLKRFPNGNWIQGLVQRGVFSGNCRFQYTAHPGCVITYDGPFEKGSRVAFPSRLTSKSLLSTKEFFRRTPPSTPHTSTPTGAGRQSLFPTRAPSARRISGVSSVDGSTASGSPTTAGLLLIGLYPLALNADGFHNAPLHQCIAVDVQLEVERPSLLADGDKSASQSKAKLQLTQSSPPPPSGSPLMPPQGSKGKRTLPSVGSTVSAQTKPTQQPSTIVTPYTHESGRKVVAKVYRLLSMEEGKPNFDPSDPVPLANCSPSEFQELCLRYRTTTPKNSPRGSHSTNTHLSVGKGPKRNQSVVPEDQQQEALQQLLSSVPHQSSVEAILVDGRCILQFLPIAIDPVDLVVEVQTVLDVKPQMSNSMPSSGMESNQKGFRKSPEGELDSDFLKVDEKAFSIVHLIHLVRQC
jgi:hypothetical protein